MAQQPPGDGHNPIVDPLYVKKKLSDEEIPAEETDKTEEEKERDTKPEDFASFGDPKELQKMKDDSEEKTKD